ncbi:hypothetical protein ACB092_01G091200 [Castanea dentata]
MCLTFPVCLIHSPPIIPIVSSRPLSLFHFIAPFLLPHVLVKTELCFFFWQTVELKVEMVGIHEKRLRKCLSKLKGIEKVEVDANSQKVVVTGYAHRNKILKAIRRGGLKADFWSAQNELLSAYASASYGSLRFNNYNLF